MTALNQSDLFQPNIFAFFPETSLLSFHMPRLENRQWVQKLLPARKPNHKQTPPGVSTGQGTSSVKAGYKPNPHRGCPATAPIPPGAAHSYRQPAAPPWLFPFQRYCGPNLNPCFGVGSSFPLGWGRSSLLALKLNHLSNRSPKIWAPCTTRCPNHQNFQT